METLILQQTNLPHQGEMATIELRLGWVCGAACCCRILSSSAVEMTSGVGCGQEQLVTTEEDTDMECDAAPVLLPGNKQGNLPVNVEGAKLCTRPLVDMTACCAMTACWAVMVEPRLPATLVRG